MAVSEGEFRIWDGSGGDEYDTRPRTAVLRLKTEVRIAWLMRRDYWGLIKALINFLLWISLAIWSVVRIIQDVRDYF